MNSVSQFPIYTAVYILTLEISIFIVSGFRKVLEKLANDSCCVFRFFPVRFQAKGTKLGFLWKTIVEEIRSKGRLFSSDAASLQCHIILGMLEWRYLPGHQIHIYHGR